jgi:hypothetical protein
MLHYDWKLADGRAKNYDEFIRDFSITTSRGRGIQLNSGISSKREPANDDDERRAIIVISAWLW